MPDAVDPFAPGNGRPLDVVEWATPHDHVATLNVVARHAKDADDLRELAEMLGYDTKAMRERYQQGLERRRTFSSAT
jgi:hypothetical protein